MCIRDSGNSTETVSIAGANGAAAPKDDEGSSGSNEDSDSQSSKSSPDALVNKALASGKKVGSGTDGIGAVSYTHLDVYKRQRQPFPEPFLEPGSGQ